MGDEHEKPDAKMFSRIDETTVEADAKIDLSEFN
jgi:hypothetical protein